MKRRSTHDSDGGEQLISAEEASNKRRKQVAEEEVEADREKRAESVLGEDLLFEVLRHADARTLARAACVSRLWRRTADDERIWEVVCTRHWANMGCGNQQLRSVVLALGGFRRLHSLYLLPLLKQPGSSSSFSPHNLLPSSSTVPAKRPGSCLPTRWGKDEVHLSLSLLSIRYYYEKMTLPKR